MTPTSIRAFENLKKICEEHLHRAYKIQVVDLLERPKLASGDQIIAVPTLVRRLPTPVRSSATFQTLSVCWSDWI